MIMEQKDIDLLFLISEMANQGYTAKDIYAKGMYSRLVDTEYFSNEIGSRLEKLPTNRPLNKLEIIICELVRHKLWEDVKVACDLMEEKETSYYKAVYNLAVDDYRFAELTINHLYHEPEFVEEARRDFRLPVSLWYNQETGTYEITTLGSNAPSIQSCLIESYTLYGLAEKFIDQIGNRCAYLALDRLSARSVLFEFNIWNKSQVNVSHDLNAPHIIEIIENISDKEIPILQDQYLPRWVKDLCSPNPGMTKNEYVKLHKEGIITSLTSVPEGKQTHEICMEFLKSDLNEYVYISDEMKNNQFFKDLLTLHKFPEAFINKDKILPCVDMPFLEYVFRHRKISLADIPNLFINQYLIIAAVFFQGGKELAFVPKDMISRKLIDYALRNPSDPEFFLQSVPEIYRDNDFWNKFISKNGSALGLLNPEDRSAELCVIALLHSKDNMKYIPENDEVRVLVSDLNYQEKVTLQALSTGSLTIPIHIVPIMKNACHAYAESSKQVKDIFADGAIDQFSETRILLENDSLAIKISAIAGVLLTQKILDIPLKSMTLTDRQMLEKAFEHTDHAIYLFRFDKENYNTGVTEETSLNAYMNARRRCSEYDKTNGFLNCENINWERKTWTPDLVFEKERHNYDVRNRTNQIYNPRLIKQEGVYLKKKKI